MKTTLAQLTTLGVGGPARRYVETTTADELVEVVRTADATGEPLLVLGGGSNVLVGDDGFDGVVVRDARCDLGVTDASACAGTTLVVAAGTGWAAVVEHAVGNGLSGVEALAGIPGSAGATPVQNVGAYGQEVAQTIASVRVWDRAGATVRTLPVADLRFGYRTSLLKASLSPAAGQVQVWGPTPRYVVLEVTFQLRKESLSRPVAYPELATALDVPVGARAPLADVRDAVLALRASKAMVLDPSDPDTRSAGSFFTNPLLDATTAAALPPDAPRFPTDGGQVKTSAAWLITHAGFAKGHGLPGPAALSTKHVLALTNRGGASAADILALAREVRAGVHARFGITLTPEPVLITCAL
ncbi:MAG: UDP-N-acetylmuramate dehydrogenase [Micrococcales bacterium]|nr:UDP-N-acetylmuramate dehydrogenase [Micrococcales bacterium]